MSFGHYHPAKDEIITTMRGDKVPLKTPAGYGGLFWGSVYGPDGKEIDGAQDYFMELAKEKDKEDDFVYWEEIADAIRAYCTQHIAPLIGSNKSHTYQSGFGGDESDGLIDFWLPVKIPKMPDFTFTIEDTVYTMKWAYSPGHHDSE